LTKKMSEKTLVFSEMVPMLIEPILLGSKVGRVVARLDSVSVLIYLRYQNPELNLSLTSSDFWLVRRVLTRMRMEGKIEKYEPAWDRWCPMRGVLTSV